MQFLVSYAVSLDHLTILTESDLCNWKNACDVEENDYRYKLDALYDLMCCDEMNSMWSLVNRFGEGISDALKNLYSSQGAEEVESFGHVIMEEYSSCYWNCNRCRCILNEGRSPMND